MDCTPAVHCAGEDQRRKPQKERRTSAMLDVSVIDLSGQLLMPTSRVKARKLLKTRKAIIFSYLPFAIQLNYEVCNPVVQEIEVCIDTGSEHIGISVKSKKHEFLHLQADNLSDEPMKHKAQASYRRTRRNRKRYRKARFNNRHIPEGWLAPTVRHKKDNHISLLKKIVGLFPITRIVAEVGQFDPALMRAKEKGKTLQGTDYQQGPAFGLENVREAVFVRDNYTCRVCGKGIKDGKILCTHHNIHRSKGGSDSADNLVTVCTDCHTSENHNEGKPLESGKFGKLSPLKDATYMNIVRSFLINEIRELFPNIEVLTTYGSYTKASRRKLGQLPKTHANDAYAMGDFHPSHRHREVHIVKRRRNNRVLCKFYDAKYIDTRDGKTKKGSELGCNRTNRREPRNNPKTDRIYRGQKVSKGRVSVRKKRYTIQSGDRVTYKGKQYTAQGTVNNGASIILQTAKQSPTGKAVTCSPDKITKVIHCAGWIPAKKK
jgi:hypothetical protein